MTAPLNDESTMNFIALCDKCGKINAVCADAPDYRKETAKFVASIVREGRRLEKMTTGEVRKPENWCHCNRKTTRAAEQLSLSEAVTE